MEGIVNARPLTYVHDDTEGVDYPLSPSHVMYGRRQALRDNKHFPGPHKEMEEPPTIVKSIHNSMEKGLSG